MSNTLLMIVLVVFLLGAVLLLAAIIAGLVEKHRSGHRPDQRGMRASKNARAKRRSKR